MQLRRVPLAALCPGVALYHQQALLVLWRSAMRACRAGCISHLPRSSELQMVLQ